MKAPPKKEGKNISRQAANVGDVASMKALPKRKGNLSATSAECEHNGHLNESPSKKVNCAPKLGRIKY